MLTFCFILTIIFFPPDSKTNWRTVTGSKQEKRKSFCFWAPNVKSYSNISKRKYYFGLENIHWLIGIRPVRFIKPSGVYYKISTFTCSLSSRKRVGSYIHTQYRLCEELQVLTEKQGETFVLKTTRSAKFTHGEKWRKRKAKYLSFSFIIRNVSKII